MKIIVNEDKVAAELGRPAGIIHADPTKLRPSEVRVLCLWLAGHTPKDIAEQMGKSWQYVNNVVFEIRQKLQANGAVQLAYLAYERGYVVIEETA